MQIQIHAFWPGLLPGLLEETELPQRFPLRLDRNPLVSTRSVNRDMPQPLLNHRDVDAGENQMAGGGVAPITISE
jgi:hypothetical protein